jgi:hypothetical protein
MESEMLRLLSIILFCFVVWQLPGTSTSNGNGAPTGACVSGSTYTDATSGWHYTCKSSAWQLGATNAMVFKRGTAGCSTGILAGTACATPITVTWSTAFSDTNYTPLCWPSGTPTNEPTAPYLVTGSKTTTTIQVNYQTTVALASSWATVDCVAIHD